jgi:hypothetical protein
VGSVERHYSQVNMQGTRWYAINYFLHGYSKNKRSNNEFHLRV